jgi:hypothetical protein
VALMRLTASVLRRLATLVVNTQLPVDVKGDCLAGGDPRRLPGRQGCAAWVAAVVENEDLGLRGCLAGVAGSGAVGWRAAVARAPAG